MCDPRPCGGRPGRVGTPIRYRYSVVAPAPDSRRGPGLPVRHPDPPVHPHTFHPFPPPPERHPDARGGPRSKDLPMSSTLPEVIASRRNRAVERATELAAQLEDGDSRSLSAQTAIEEALRDVRHYSSLAVDLAEVADDTAVYNARSDRSVVADLRSLNHGDRGAQLRLDASHRELAAEAGVETRDFGTSSTLAAVPAWLISEARPMAIGRAPLVSIAATVAVSGSSPISRCSR